MNISLQIGRGFAAVALCAAASAFAVTHPAIPMTQASALASQTATAAHAAKSRIAHDKKQRCELPVPSIEIGAPIAITTDSMVLTQATR